MAITLPPRNILTLFHGSPQELMPMEEMGCILRVVIFFLTYTIMGDCSQGRNTQKCLRGYTLPT